MTKRKLLSKKEIKELNEIVSKYAISFEKKAKIEIVDEKWYFIERELMFFVKDGIIIPSLKWQLRQGICFQTATIDMGAIKFVVGGADIMRPGIVDVPLAAKKGDFVTVIDEQNQKPLSIGILLFEGSEIAEMKSGRVIQNIHYIGDELWNKSL